MTVGVYRADSQCCHMVVTYICQMVSQKMLDSAKSLVTNFQLKSARSSESLLKNVFKMINKKPVKLHSISVF